MACHMLLTKKIKNQIKKKIKKEGKCSATRREEEIRGELAGRERSRKGKVGKVESLLSTLF